MIDPPQTEIPDFATLAADPEIAPLLNFEPVVRKIKRPDGWTPELQRELIARIAATGTIQQAVWQMGKHATGAEALYKKPGADSFRQSWDAAIIIGRRRNGLDSQAPFMGEVPGITRRGKLLASTAGPLPGQVMNERGEWEDEASMRARGEEAKESVCEKLLRCRRLFLAEISGCPGKRAAFEILTELAVDWEKAARLEPQPDEPWKSPNQRQPDMILTAESGWTAGEWGYGPDKRKELREALNEFLKQEGRPPIEEDEAPSAAPPTRSGAEAARRDASPDRTAADRASSEGNPSDGEVGRGAQLSGRNSEHHSRPAKQPSSSQDRSGPRVRRV
jgi:hypothetical protein